MAIKRNKRVAMIQEIAQVTQANLEDANTTNLPSKASATTTKKSTNRKSTKKTTAKKTTTRKKTTKSKKTTGAAAEGVV